MTTDNQFCSLTGASYPKWTNWDVLVWRLWPQALGGGTPTLTHYKDAWVVYNKLRIISYANSHHIPPILLACVAWTEVGGKPDWIKRPVFELRSFDWSGPTWVDTHLTITKPPEQTSVGAVAIQLGVVARELNIDIGQLTHAQQSSMIDCLETDAFNLDIVARHLRDLILHDYPHADTRNLTEEQFIVAGSRYNRGEARALSDFQASIQAAPGSANRVYSSYGRAMLAHRAHIQQILGL
jgi:hypothetical protein